MLGIFLMLSLQEIKVKINNSLFIICILSFLQSCDTVTKTYSNWNSIISAKENEKDWLPPIITEKKMDLIENIYNIRETHNLDTNQTWGKFELTDAMIDMLFQYYNPDDKAKFKFKNEMHKFKDLNIEEIYCFFSDIKKEKYWYYALNKKRKILFFISYYRME
jgi:hypothetical protein